MESRRLHREGNVLSLGSLQMLILLLLCKQMESYQRFTEVLNDMTILVFKGNNSNSSLRMDLD